jgi:hypothetical protein
MAMRDFSKPSGGPNPILEERLEGIRKHLLAAHESGGNLTSTSKGVERELFLSRFLSRVMPPPFRFGSGDVTDSLNVRSGQIDIIVEYPWLPSLPLLDEGPRLYLAEGVAACIEVKSNLADQWQEVQGTAGKLAGITRRLDILWQRGTTEVPSKIPLFAVGYRGWSSKAAIEERLEADARLAGVLVLDSALMAFKPEFGGFGPEPRIRWMDGSFCLWGLISCLDTIVKKIVLLNANPFGYYDRAWLCR